MKTLVVDGNSLLQTGYHGVKDFYHNDLSFGAIYFFLNTIRHNLTNDTYDRVVVFWDGKNNHDLRRKIYSEYKRKRRIRLNQFQLDDMFRQKNRICEYLEELSVRQIGFEGIEADDCISYYCHNSPNQQKVILTNDKDLVQLVSENVSVLMTRTNEFITSNDTISLGRQIKNLPVYNVALVKILLGDKSDNIKGISYFGEKSLIKHFNEIFQKKVSIEDIRRKTKIKIEEGNKERGIMNLHMGISSDGRRGDDFFVTNQKLIELTDEIIPKDIKDVLTDIINESLDPEGRKTSNVIQMMKTDGLFKVLPKKEDNWVEFIQPYLKIQKKELNYYNQTIN